MKITEFTEQELIVHQQNLQQSLTLAKESVKYHQKRVEVYKQKIKNAAYELKMRQGV